MLIPNPRLSSSSRFFNMDDLYLAIYLSPSRWLHWLLIIPYCVLVFAMANDVIYMIPGVGGRILWLSWWRHQMETFSALLALYAGNSPIPGEFPAQRPVTRSFDVFFDLRLNKRLSKQPWGWWFEMQSGSLWRHCNGYIITTLFIIHIHTYIHK